MDGIEVLVLLDVSGLEDIEKFIVVEQLLEKTWFAPIFYYD